jgi:hypothetical protein
MDGWMELERVECDADDAAAAAIALCLLLFYFCHLFSLVGFIIFLFVRFLSSSSSKHTH